MTTAEPYYSVAHFCNLHHYKMPTVLCQQLEQRLLKVCEQQNIQTIVRTNNRFKKQEICFPQEVLDDYFPLWVK